MEVIELPSLSVEYLSILALSREKDKKRIERRWHFEKEELTKPPYATLWKFVTQNLSVMFNLPETPVLRGRSKSRPPITLLTKDARKERARAYVCDFLQTKGKELLHALSAANQGKKFEDCATEVGELFKETPFWPKTYLFTAQFRVESKTFSHNYAGILATKLEYGVLAENQAIILEQLKQGTINEKVNKGLIYPHTIERAKSIEVEDRAKVYETTSIPANYFYSFIGLKPPASAQEELERQYLEYQGAHPNGPLEGFARSVSAQLLSNGLVKVTLDFIEFDVSLFDLQRRFHFVRLADGKYLLVAKGTRLTVGLGREDLIFNKAIQVLTRNEFLHQLLKEEQK